MNDVSATIELFQALCEQFHTLPDNQKQLLYFLWSQSQDQNIVFLEEFLFGVDTQASLPHLESFKESVTHIVSDNLSLQEVH